MREKMGCHDVTPSQSRTARSRQKTADHTMLMEPVNFFGYQVSFYRDLIRGHLAKLVVDASPLDSALPEACLHENTGCIAVVRTEQQKVLMEARMLEVMFKLMSTNGSAFYSKRYMQSLNRDPEKNGDKIEEVEDKPGKKPRKPRMPKKAQEPKPQPEEPEAFSADERAHDGDDDDDDLAEDWKPGQED